MLHIAAQTCPELSHTASCAEGRRLARLEFFSHKPLQNPSSVVVLGKFRRFHLLIFSLFLPNLVFSYIYGIFSMPFGGFFY